MHTHAFFETALRGFLLGGGLIIAIGAQNAFVLKQGLMKKHVFAVCAVCALWDALLIVIGVMGLGVLFSSSAMLSNILAAGGALFLLVYGGNSFRHAWRGGDKLRAAEGDAAASLGKTLALAMAFTVPNPHVYLDTVIVIGGIAGTLSLAEKTPFAGGAALASVVWFFALGYGARLMIPLFRKATTWRVLNFIIGCVMWWIAAELALFIIGQRHL